MTGPLTRSPKTLFPTMTECLECGAPADADGGHWMDAEGFGPGPERIWVDSITCAAGHRYDLVDESKTVTL